MRKSAVIFSFIALFFSSLFALQTDAVAQQRNEREIRDTLRSLRSKADDLDYTLMYRLRSSSASPQTINDAAASIDALKNAMRSYEGNLNLRRENRNDVQPMINAAQDINGFLRSNPQNRHIEEIWGEVRDLVGRLSSFYGLTPDWNGRISNATRDTTYDNTTYGGTSSALTGTYQLDSSRSEDVNDIIGGVRVSASQRADLANKLDAPAELAISVRGDQVTLASSNASPITFAADGTEKTEYTNGRTIRVRATLEGDVLTIASLGGETDYTVTFAPEGSGRELKVTRRITTEYVNETIFSDSFYTRSSDLAGLGIDDGNVADRGGYSQNDNTSTSGDTGYSTNMPAGTGPNPTLSQPRIGEFIVPNGMVVTGLLENEINTKVSQNNDRFKMTVQTPMEYRGAVIEGYITGVGRSGQVSGRSNVTFNFERITLRDGRAYDFNGTLQALRDESGKEVKVDTEGTVKGDSQTKETAKRGGIGAGLGAVIGAIAGGGKGAVLGAIIGGGAGAGSVLVGGRDDVRLMPGSTITVESSSPVRGSRPQSN